MDAREMLRQNGYLPSTGSTGHGDAILAALEQHSCEVCHLPVGAEARGSTICMNCLKAGH